MCNPIAMGVLMGGQAALSYAGQKKAAKASWEYQNQVFQQNKQIADAAAFNQYRGMQQRIAQEREAMSMEILNARRQAFQAMAQGRAAAGEAGVAGASVSALLSDFERQQAETIYTRERSQQYREMAMMDQMEAIRSQQQGRILAALPEPVQQPNPLMIATGAAQGFMQGLQMFGVQTPGGGISYEAFGKTYTVGAP
jgi:hypothetical protein